MKNEYLCFVKYIGKDSDGLNNYELLFTEDTENFWGENFEYKPSGICNELIPDKDSYNETKLLKTNIVFDLAQDSTCFGFQDCMDGIIALMYENIDDYDEYPDPFRIVFHYGDSINDIKIQLAKRNMLLKEKGEN